MVLPERLRRAPSAVLAALLAGSTAFSSLGARNPIAAMVAREACATWPPGQVPFGIAFFVGRDDILVTAAHVIAGCGTIEIVGPNGGRAASARLLLSDEANDIAVLRATAPSRVVGRLASGGIRPGATLLRSAPASRGEVADATTVLAAAGGIASKPLLVLAGLFAPGMSGSPLVDDTGGIAGMLVAVRSGPPRRGLAIEAAEIARDLRRLRLPSRQPVDGAGDFTRVVRCRSN